MTIFNNKLTQDKEDVYKKDINTLVSAQVKVISFIIALAGLLSLLFEVKFFYNNSISVYISRLGAIAITFLVLILSNFKVGKKYPSLLVHVLLLSITVSFSSIIVRIPESLEFNAQIFSLIVFTASLFISWDSKHQIIAAIYFNVIFIGAIYLGYHSGFSILSNEILEPAILILLISLLAATASSINARLRKNALFRKYELEESDKKYKDIFEYSAEGIFRCDFGGKFQMLNPSMTKMLGYESMQDFKNKNFFKDVLVSKRDADVLKKIMYKQSILKNYRIRFKKYDNSEIIVRANIRLHSDEKRQKSYFDGSIQNITQQVIAESERQKAINALRKAKIQSDADAVKAKEDASFKTMYLANMSHEIRTPINSVIGSLDIIDNGLYNGELDLKKLVRNAKISAESMLEILNNILDLSKIEAGRMELDEVDFDLRDEIDKAMAIISPKAQEKNIKLTLKIDENLPRIFSGDPVRYRQVLLNLLSNSVKFTEKGEVGVSISVVAVKDNRIKIVTSVKDSGKGIPEDKMQDLFKAFSQIREKGDQREGTGLGLVISSEFVRLMGGRFEVDSEMEVGSRFRFSVIMKFKPDEEIINEKSKSSIEPEKKSLTLVMEPDDLIHEDKSSLNDEVIKEKLTSIDIGVESEASDKQETEEAVEKKAVNKILLVEDNPISQQLEMKILTEIGYQVTPVNNGVEALKALEESQYNLVLMDVEMPEMDGLTATGKIRAKRELDNLPVIAVTAHSTMKDRQKCLDAGMDDYMSKPISVQFLKLIIDKWIKQGRQVN